MSLGDCWFTNALGGTADWIYPDGAADFQSPAVAGVVDGGIYQYRAQNFDQTEWEIGTGAYTASTKVFARTTIKFNHLGDTSKIDFSTPPHIVIREAGGQSPGTGTNDNAGVGNIGEIRTASLARASAADLVTMTFKTICSISLPPGDWDVTGVVGFLPAATTNVTVFFGDFSLVDNTIDVTPGNFIQIASPTTAGTVYANDMVFTMPTVRYSLAVTTIIYLVVDANFTIAGCKAYGNVRARRAR